MSKEDKNPTQFISLRDKTISPHFTENRRFFNSTKNVNFAPHVTIKTYASDMSLPTIARYLNVKQFTKNVNKYWKPFYVFNNIPTREPGGILVHA